MVDIGEYKNSSFTNVKPMEFVTMTQFRRFQFVMIAVIAVLCMITMVAICDGQELQEAPTGISQTVTIKDQGNIRAFRRERLEANWSEWIEWAPKRSDEKSKIFKPREVNQEVVNKIIGKDILKWLSKRPSVSGHYNFSGNKNYDWKNFGGDKFGTWMTTVKLYPPTLVKK